jgi:hypothetical protein
VKVLGNRVVKGLNITCVVGECEIRKARVQFTVRKKVYNVKAQFQKSFNAGETVVIQATMPQYVYRKLSKSKTLGSVTFSVTAVSDNGSTNAGTSSIGLRR